MCNFDIFGIYTDSAGITRFEAPSHAFMSIESHSLRKKMCLLGTSAVGKTSLVSRFVHDSFSDKYLTTVGVKISRKPITLRDGVLDLLIWDLNGEDRFNRLSSSYLRGTAGYFLVADGTRSSTLHRALEIHQRTLQEIGSIPRILVINKVDLESTWEIDEDDINKLKEDGWDVILTSAKTGTRIEEAFTSIAEKMIRE